MHKKKALYFHPHLATFVKKDISFLETDFDLKIYEYNPKSKIAVIFLFIHQFFYLIANIIQSKIIIVQFGGYHSFLPTLFGKIFKVPTLIVLGGTDCVSFPSINYGNFNKKTLAWFTKKTYQWATHLSPVHESLVYTPYTYQNDDFPFQGYKYFCPNIKTPYTVIHNGYDAKKFEKKNNSIPNTFLTIAHLNPKRIKVKGIDLILEAAKEFPHCTFTLIGNEPNNNYNDLPSNIVLKPFLSNDLLAEEYSKHTYYLQLSINEGFPNALCEAMLCECVPICSAVGSMPYIVDNTGYVLKKRDVNELIALTKQALSSSVSEMAKKARERIKENFTEEIRKKELLQLVQKICLR